MDFEGGLSNEDIFSALKDRGINTGPITETTRAVYIKKLKSLLLSEDSSQSPARTCRHCHSASNNSPIQFNQKASHNVEKVEGSSDCRKNGQAEVAEVGLANFSLSDHHSIPETITFAAAVPAPPPPPCSSTSFQEIVRRILETFDDSNHVANDTVFFFQEGKTVSVSRAILASQCQQLIPILYSSGEMFAVKVSSLSGQTQDYFVREHELVADLKEKIYLKQNLRVEQQRLVFRQKELLDSCTLHDSGVEPSNTVHLVIGGHPEGPETASSSYTCASYHPALSIQHLHLDLHPELLQPHPSSLSHTRLAPHLSHIVHVHNGQYHGFRLFLHYLYCKELRVAGSIPEASVVESYAVCWTLGEFFQVPCLVSACRIAMAPLLDHHNARSIYNYAHAVNSCSLQDFTQKYKDQQNIT